MKPFMVRQGDVILVRVDDATRIGDKIPRDNGRIVLAHGEVTGHAHVIRSRKAELFSLAPDMTADGDRVWADADRILRTSSEVSLTHEEHAPVTLPPGTYRVAIQREYSPESIRNVAD